MRPLFIVNKSGNYRSEDPNWRAVAIQKGYDRFCMLRGRGVQIVSDYRIRIPLLRKLEP